LQNRPENALRGRNMETGVVLRGPETDPLVAQVRQHIEACAVRSELFDPRRLRFYETVQRDLHRRIGPGGIDSEDFPGCGATPPGRYTVPLTISRPCTGC
jgi:hypothetical protein